ncbi:MAG TPA: OmpA family protein [Flavobacterium sp.]|jgi:outer membrane protein OmpA-like peptidoglycan-associated protein
MKFLLTIICAYIFLPVAAQQQYSVYFESDQFDLTPKQVQLLEKWTTENDSVKIVGVYGFCDEDGSSGYNDTLAKKRIDHVISRIRGKINLRDDFRTRSFGELHQQSKIKAENRKVTLYYLEPKDLSREDEILGLKKEPVPVVRSKKNYPKKIIFDNPDGTTSEYALDVAFMNRIDMAEPGEKLKLENLNFHLNTFAIVSESRGKMFELLLVLQRNPQMKVEIHGHLCCSPTDRTDLSTQRAKAIRNFLTGNGIDKTRLSYKGFGSTQPIHPLPEKNESERAANRRVEILIVSN